MKDETNQGHEIRSLVSRQVKRLKWAKKGNSMWIDPYGAKTTKGVFEGLSKNGILSALSSADLTSN